MSSFTRWTNASASGFDRIGIGSMTSYHRVLKRVDVALVAAVDAILAGEKKIFTTLGIKEGGVSAIALDEGGMADSKCLIADHPDVAAKMREVGAQIADGTLKLTDPMMAK